jgi:hypothetical protein
LHRYTTESSYADRTRDRTGIASGWQWNGSNSQSDGGEGGDDDGDEVGLYKVNLVCIYSLKAPGFNPCLHLGTL